MCLAWCIDTRFSTIKRPRSVRTMSLSTGLLIWEQLMMMMHWCSEMQTGQGAVIQHGLVSVTGPAVILIQALKVTLMMFSCSNQSRSVGRFSSNDSIVSRWIPALQRAPGEACMCIRRSSHAVLVQHGSHRAQEIFIVSTREASLTGGTCAGPYVVSGTCSW